MVAAPLYALLRKNASWKWGDEEESAMDQLKLELDYTEGHLEIILGVDASLKGWGIETNAMIFSILLITNERYNKWTVPI
jgi:hypothetical protein